MVADAASACRLNTLRDLGTALQACKKSAQWQQALHLLSHVHSLGQGNAILYTAAMGACKTHWPGAVQLLSKMKSSAVEADAFCGTALLPLLAWRKALYLHQKEATGVNTITLNAALKSCEKSKQWECALGILHQGDQFQVDLISFNTTISACSWSWALQLLQSAGSMTIVTVNSAMKSLVSGEQWHSALSLLATIHFRRLSMTSVTRSTAIAACDRGGLWQLALALLWDDLAVGNTQVITISSAITACERAGQWQQALQVFWELAGRVKVDIIAFNAAISATREWLISMQLLSILRPRGLVPTAVTVASIASSCANGRQWLRAVAMASRSSLVGCNAAISACEGTGHWQQPLTFLTQMKSEALQPSSVSWNSCTSAMTQRWRVALVFLQQSQALEAEGLATLPLSNAAMSACQTCARWPRTLTLLAELPQLQLQGDLLSFSAGLSFGSSWSCGLGMLQSLRDLEVQADVIAYDAILSMLEKAEQGVQLLKLLRDLRRLGEHLLMQNEVLFWASAAGVGTEIGELSESSTFLLAKGKSKYFPTNAF